MSGAPLPEAEVAEDFFHHSALVNHRNNAHRLLAVGAEQRVGVPHFEDEVAPLFGREIGGRWWGARRRSRALLPPRRDELRGEDL